MSVLVTVLLFYMRFSYIYLCTSTFTYIMYFVCSSCCFHALRSYRPSYHTLNKLNSEGEKKGEII